MKTKDLSLTRELYGSETDQGGRLIADHAIETARYLESVAKQTEEIFGSELECLLRGALGHDLLEDTDAKPETVAGRWGADALLLIESMTNEKGDNDFADYLRHLKTAPEEVLLIKLADIFDNVRNSSRNAKLDLEWARNFWLPLLMKYKRAFFGRNFKKYPRSAKIMVADIENGMKTLYHRTRRA